MKSSTTLLMTLRTLREVHISLALSNLAAYYVAFDRWSDARIHAREALCVARETRQYADIAAMLEHLAAIAALSEGPKHERASGRRELAAMLLGYAARYGARVGAARNAIEQKEYDRALSALRGALGSVELATLMAGGESMTLNEAIEQALSI